MKSLDPRQSLIPSSFFSLSFSLSLLPHQEGNLGRDTHSHAYTGYLRNIPRRCYTAFRWISSRCSIVCSHTRPVNPLLHTRAYSELQIGLFYEPSGPAMGPYHADVGLTFCNTSVSNGTDVIFSPTIKLYTSRRSQHISMEPQCKWPHKRAAFYGRISFLQWQHLM